LFDRTLYPISNEIKNSDFINVNKIKRIDVGTSLPFQLFEREDNIRSLFKIKGFQNIKNHYNTLIRREITKNNSYCIDHLNPDLRIEIFIDNNLNFKLKYKTRDIILLGRYNKYQKGLIQRIKYREGKNEQTDLKNFRSQLQEIYTIEDIVLNFLNSQFLADSIKISWLGSEDKDSLVLGNGRPFIVRIVNPLNNIFEKEYEIKNKLFLSFKEISYDEIHLYNKYKIKLRVYVRVIEENLEIVDLEKSIPNLIGETRFKIKRKIVKRNIYSSNFKVIDNKNFELDLVLDNGIPIKQLIGGQESINPCVSNLLNKKCECVFFDIYDIDFNCN
jgi:tRNA pseudouridine synthase 10